MEILKLLEYNRWANGLIASQIETLTAEICDKDSGGSFGSIQATLAHLLEADWLWLSRFQGNASVEVPNWKKHSAHAILPEWIRIQDEMMIASRQLLQDPNTQITFKTRKGQPFTMPPGEIITHISHHGSYHRGQLANMIRMAGEKPVSTDYFLFSIQKG